MREMFSNADREINPNPRLPELYNHISAEEMIEENLDTGEIIIDSGGVWVNFPEKYNNCARLLSRSVNKYKSIKTVDFNNKPIDLDRVEEKPFKDEPYAIYYLNKINSMEAIEEFLDEIYQLEDVPFGIQVAFGAIFEKRMTIDMRAGYHYHSTPAHDNIFQRFSPHLVRNN